MSFQFDHFIHVVDRPESVIEQYHKFGLHAVEGGRHEQHGTYNALCYVNKLSYIELLGIFDRSLVEQVSEQDHLLRATIVNNNYRSGTTRIALRTKAIDQDAKKFKQLGLEVYGPIAYSRKRPDGSLVTWKLLFAGKTGQYPELPFFIQWDESDEERLADLTKRETIKHHIIGDTKLASIGIAVKDSVATSKQWAHLLQLEISSSHIDESLNAQVQRLRLEGGNIAFYEPIGEGKV